MPNARSRPMISPTSAALLVKSNFFLGSSVFTGSADKSFASCASHVNRLVVKREPVIYNVTNNHMMHGLTFSLTLHALDEYLNQKFRR